MLTVNLTSPGQNEGESMRDQAAVTAVQTEMPGVPLPAASAPERTSVARPERQHHWRTVSYVTVMLRWASKECERNLVGN